MQGPLVIIAPAAPAIVTVLDRRYFSISYLRYGTVPLSAIQQFTLLLVIVLTVREVVIVYAVYVSEDCKNSNKV